MGQFDDLKDTQFLYRYKLPTFNIPLMSSTLSLFELLKKFNIIKDYQTYPVPNEPVIDVTYWFHQ